MSFQEILHLVVLALSLATVLITLFMYLLFKIRQLPKAAKEQAIVSEGLYFRRYLPGLKADTSPEDSKPASIDQRSWRTLPVFFVTLTGILFVALASGHYVVHFPSRTHAIQTSNAEDTYALLRSAHILIWQPKASASSAVELWSSFLSAHAIAFQKSSSLAHRSADVLVVPEAKQLSGKEREELQAWIKSGKSVLASGPIGALDGDGKVSKHKFSEEVFSVALHPNPEASAKFSTIFAADRAPWWDIPPGLLLDWQPLDSTFVGTLSAGHPASAFEASNVTRIRHLEGEGQAEIVRASFKTENNVRLGWLAFDPLPAKANVGEQHFYADLVIASSLNWCAHRLQTTIAHWPKGTPSSVVLSVDSEDKFEGALELSSIFQGLHLPATFFIVTNELKKDPTLVTTPDPAIEFASHTVDHTNLEGETLDSQFSQIQRARFESSPWRKSRSMVFDRQKKVMTATHLQRLCKTRCCIFSAINVCHAWRRVGLPVGK